MEQQIITDKKILFISDFHLGIPNEEESRKRELKIVRFLKSLEEKISHIYFLGDIFDFWFEYKNAIPKGYSRFFGQLANLSDQGVKLTFFKGNHDMWMFDYLKKEFNANVITNELLININGQKIFMHHGDGLGKGDYAYKLLKGFFRSSVCQWLFARLHPNFGIGIANFLSKKSRLANGKILPEQPLDKEILYQYIVKMHKELAANIYICGHRHLAMHKLLANNAVYINTGNCFKDFNYAMLVGAKIELYNFEKSFDD